MSFKDPLAGDVTIPSHLTADVFGKVNVRDTEQGREVRFTILLSPQGKSAEGWQTGVALDGSLSLKGAYGRRVEGRIPEAVADLFKKKGWIQTKQRDGKPVEVLKKEAFDEAINKGYLRPTQNVVEGFAREFLAFLADELDADAGTTLIYWACGDGSQYEIVGDFSSNQCKQLSIEGPQKFGTDTLLLPAVQYFVERFKDAKRGMYLFITDGRLADLEAVKAYTITLAKEIESKKRNPVKCVLIGIGDDFVESQLEELDDLDTGTDVDIWDHKIARDLRNITEIFAEVADENLLVAPSGTIYDANGKVTYRYSDGLPAVVSVTLPKDSEWFELEVGGNRFRQTVVVSQQVK